MQASIDEMEITTSKLLCYLENIRAGTEITEISYRELLQQNQVDPDAGDLASVQR